MIHATSEIHSKNIGKDTKIWQFCIILEDAVIGENCNINSHVFIENDVIIGNNVTVKAGVQLWDGLRIRDNVFIGPNVTFTNDLYPRSKVYPKSFKRTIIEKGVSIGANSTILSGLSIGEFALIGAGSVITKSVPPFTVWYGNPGIQKGYITPEGKIINNNLEDKSGVKYKLESGKPIML